MAGDAGEDNLVSRAVRLFRARTGFDRPLEIVLEKRVPLGGGLGGGSSDAASTLLALNTLSGAGLTGQDLGKLAVELGSDVPFFLTGGLAWVTGRGERIEALEWSLPPGLAVVLVNPGFPSVTAGAFTRLDVYRAAHTGEPALDRAAAMAMLGAGPEAWTFRNDFLPVFLAGGDRQAEAYGAILGELRRLGAAFAGLSGAGSTCFGIFRGSKEAEKALGGLKKRWECVYIKIPLAHSREVML
jgi:4-diphosphocytidyl-2-C-methyl-D-erythritol kinase